MVSNIGDSRAILCRKSQTSDLSFELYDLSSDHKLTRQDERRRVASCGAEIIDAFGGRLTASNKDFTKQELKQLKLGLNMSRALGHIILRKYGVSSEPEFSFLNVEDGDIVICATDGLWEGSSDKEIVDLVVSNYNSVSQLARELCRFSDQKWNQQRLLADNITIVVLKFHY